MADVLATKWFWAVVAIVSMWMAVLFTGIFGPEIVNDDVTGHQRVPVAVAIAFFAVFGTLVVARHGFRGGEGDTRPLRDEIDAERERRRALEGEVDRLKRDVAGLREAYDTGLPPKAALDGLRGL